MEWAGTPCTAPMALEFVAVVLRIFVFCVLHLFDLLSDRSANHFHIRTTQNRNLKAAVVFQIRNSDSVIEMEAPPAPPNNTLYLNNLSDKLKRKRLQESLRAVFKQFGDIIDIHCWQKSLARKGQAWVIFKEVSSAMKALTSMQGFPFYDKPMRIQFARADSDLVGKARGTFIPRPKKKATEKTKKVKPVAAPAGVGGLEARPAPINPENIPDNQPPHNILFVTNLPQEGGEEFLSQMFQQYQGFHEVRMVPSRPDIAFVEYENEIFASMAKDGLQGFKVTPTQKIKVVFAKK